MIGNILRELKKSPTSLLAATFILLFVLIALFAPLLASNQPLFVWFEGAPYFPLFRFLLYPGFYTKSIDRFFNLFLLFLPLFVIFWKKPYIPLLLFVVAWGYFSFFPVKGPSPTYQKLEELISYTLKKRQQERLTPLLSDYRQLLEAREGKEVPLSPEILPTLWNIREREVAEKRARFQRKEDTAGLIKLNEREEWFDEQSKRLLYIMPLLRPFHYEVDAGGSQLLNQLLPWYELTRLNRKDLAAALIFGTRISLVVGIGSVVLMALIGLPLGAAAGYFSGKTDLAFSRLIEVWEGMPVFFMLLMIVAITESKTIGWLILIIALFGWTSFARYVRSEAYRIRSLPYILAAKTYGAKESRILFRYLLPNALVSFFALLPFAILGAITAESGISFLGLGDEGSPSLGVLMDEGRSHFPAESYLLWPPAIFLTLALISFALLGDTLKHALDPKRN